MYNNIMQKEIIKNKKIISKKAGFLLIELLVTIPILLIGFFVYSNASATTLKSLTTAENTITATFLAQDGMEYIKGLRAEMYIEPKIPADPNDAYENDFDDVYKYLKMCGNGGRDCSLDTPNHQRDGSLRTFDGVHKCPPNTAPPNYGCPVVLYNTVKHVYRNEASSDTVDTIFTRFLRLEELGPDDVQLRITVVVKWFEGGEEKRVELTNTVFDIAEV